MNKTQLEQMGACAVNAAKSLQTATAQQKNIFFEEAIKLIQKNINEILDANLQDINDAHSKNKDDAFIDRLKLDNERIDGICDALNEIQTFPDPVGKTLASWKRPNGLQIDRVSTPLGVIGIIFESRPNVASDASALCIKSGNAVILRSGSDGLRTSKAIVLQIQNALKNAELPKFAVQIVDSTERAAVDLMLGGLGNTIDVIVPRGGKSLVEAVERSAKVPVFGHLEGICHIFIDKQASHDIAINVCLNSKMRRPGICGAVETLLLHENIKESIGKAVIEELLQAGCEVRGCEQTLELSKDVKSASDDDWSTEYLAPIISIKIVKDLDEAIKHIREFGTGHTESIISSDKAAQDQFTNEIDSEIVMVKSSTQFADGGEFGLGGEIGIATGKFHARGPVGVEQLTSFKYLVRGDGQVRK